MLRHFWALSFLIVLLGVGGSSTQTPSDCEIPARIAAAPSGSVIELPEGRCYVNLTIYKSLTLRGAGSDKTQLKGQAPGKPVLYIESSQPIEVTIENLALAEAPRLSAEKECAIFYPELICPAGLQVRGKASAILRRARVMGNAWVGVYVLDAGRVLVQETEIGHNGWGVYLSGDAQVTLERSRVLDNLNVGLEAWAAVTLRDSRIQGNGTGVKLALEQANILNNIITENSGHGLLVMGLAQVHASSNEITNNRGWGIVAWLRQCGFASDNFNGQVTASENRVSENRAGQVCLP
jgi:nitrous oxidase accessory protein NosD